MIKQSVKRDVNDSSTWAYPAIPSGVTIIRKENVTDEEIYKIYKDCIDIQREAYIRMIKQRVSNSHSKKLSSHNAQSNEYKSF